MSESAIKHCDSIIAVETRLNRTINRKELSEPLPNKVLNYLFEEAVHDYEVNTVREYIKYVDYLLNNDLSLECIGVFDNNAGPIIYEQAFKPKISEEDRRNKKMGLLEKLIETSIESEMPFSAMPDINHNVTYITNNFELEDSNQKRGGYRTMCLVFKKNDLNFTGEVYNKINKATNLIKPELTKLLQLNPM